MELWRNPLVTVTTSSFFCAWAELGVSAVDVRLFGYGAAQSLDGTIDNMRRFRDGVLSKL